LHRAGLSLNGLAQILEVLGHKGIVSKNIYTIPMVQNPTGSIMPRGRREDLLDLTRNQGVPRRSVA
jgi:2-aminoadipate transaminase